MAHWEKFEMDAKITAILKEVAAGDDSDAGPGPAYVTVDQLAIELALRHPSVHDELKLTVEGKVYQWKAGDLMLSAPGWAVHNHASYDDYVYELTVQDQPLNIAMESLLWQESLKMPMAVLGVEEGFGTNRQAAE